MVSETWFLTKVGFPPVSFGEKPGFLDMGWVRKGVFDGLGFQGANFWEKPGFLASCRL